LDFLWLSHNQLDAARNWQPTRFKKVLEQAKAFTIFVYMGIQDPWTVRDISHIEEKS
jgi:hypothetical protein